MAIRALRTLKQINNLSFRSDVTCKLMTYKPIIENTIKFALSNIKDIKKKMKNTITCTTPLLFDVKISDADKNILKNLTYILCGFSIVGLMATLAVFLTVR